MREDYFYRNRIIFRLTGLQKEQNYEDAVSVPFLDMAITFHYLLNCQEEGVSSFCITNRLMEEWKLSVEQLMKMARANTPKYFPASICSMREMLETLAGRRFPQQGEENALPDMYVMTNSNSTYGASVLLYPGVLRKFASEKQSDFYVIPSSVHEVILVPWKGSEQTKELDRMVQNVNDTQVPEEEILSDRVQFYSWREDRFLERNGMYGLE